MTKMHDRSSRRHFLAQSVALAPLGYVRGFSGAAPTIPSEATMSYGNLVGQPIAELPTPALMIDLDEFEKNMARMAAALRGKSAKLRPHGKAHKSPEIGKLQLASGAIGLCAAKLGEADVFVNGGITDVLVTAEVVGRRKIEKAIGLIRRAPDLKLVVDDARNAAEIAAAAQAAGVRVKVAIDLNVGQNRAGVDTPEAAVALARAIAREKALEFIGLQAYGGMNMHVVGFENRRDASLLALDRALAARRALETAGFELQLLSVGGTGTYNIDCDVPGVTEIQPGSYIFMDAHYSSIGGIDSDAFSDFGNALTVLATVISRPAKGRAITDGGNKALSTDESMPVPKGLTGISYRPGGDEYGVLTVKNANRPLAVGDKVEFIVGHCDTTVNLHDIFYGVRKGVVEKQWAIAARGRTD
jgi:D-serine deaminase-like pyridoxal phosphate-dependent protein